MSSYSSSFPCTSNVFLEAPPFDDPQAKLSSRLIVVSQMCDHSHSKHFGLPIGFLTGRKHNSDLVIEKLAFGSIESSDERREETDDRRAKKIFGRATKS
jgi:hypothetical protein